MVDRTSEFIKCIADNGVESSVDAGNYYTPKSPSLFLIKACTTWSQIDSFENVFRKCFDGYVGFHRFLPNDKTLGKLLNFTDTERTELMEQVIAFLSFVAKDIQQLNRQLDTSYSNPTMPDQNYFYQQVVSGLLQKLQRFSKVWDQMQKQHKKYNSSPCRLFSYYYSSSGNYKINNFPSRKEISEDASKDQKQSKVSNDLKKPMPSAIVQAPEKSFADRYVDEIAPPTKMKQYELVATQQKDLLMRESKSLQNKFSQEMMQSQQLESSVMSISNLIAEFATLIESQSEVVELVGETAKDATNSVKLADEELLTTIERSHSYQWSMIGLILGLSFLLLILHVITP